jgi:hypothetical protein
MGSTRMCLGINQSFLLEGKKKEKDGITTRAVKEKEKSSL